MILVDTDIWLRMQEIDTESAMACFEALNRAKEQGDGPAICAQIVVEYCAVASRPIEANGLGKTWPAVQESLKEMFKASVLLPEPEDVAGRWQELARKYRPIGKRCHDLRLAAVASANGVRRILTFNRADFQSVSEVQALSPLDP